MTCLSRSSSPPSSRMGSPRLTALGNRVEAKCTFFIQPLFSVNTIHLSMDMFIKHLLLLNCLQTHFQGRSSRTWQISRWIRILTSEKKQYVRLWRSLMGRDSDAQTCHGLPQDYQSWSLLELSGLSPTLCVYTWNKAPFIVLISFWGRMLPPHSTGIFLKTRLHMTFLW